MGKKLGVTDVNEILTSSNRTLNNAEDNANQLNGNFTPDGSNARCKLSYDICSCLRRLKTWDDLVCVY